jgi:hypothetical protein
MPCTAVLLLCVQHTMVQETDVAFNKGVSSGCPPLLTNVTLVLLLLLLLLQAQFGQILVQVTREATMAAVGYFNAVQAAGQAAGPTASPTVVMPVKQVGWAGNALRWWYPLCGSHVWRVFPVSWN